jgi:tetratricopeptide (TPR) repeat protein
MNITLRVVLVAFMSVVSVAAQQPTPDPVASLRDQIAAAANDPDRIRLQLKRAEDLVNTGHREEALQELNAIAKSGAFDPTGFYNLGNALARLGESEAALGAYREAITQRRGKYSRALNNMGVVLLREGRWDEAYDSFNSALKIESFRYAEASYNLGRLYAARGQRDLAAREWRRALVIDPEHDATKQALANVRTADKIEVVEAKPVKAAAAAETKAGGPKTLLLDRTSFDYLQKARTASERGKTTEAIENFHRVLERQGGYFAPANLELSYVLLGQKRYDEALGNLIAVTKRDGARYPISYYHLGRVYEAKGDLKSAETAFARVITAYVPTSSQFLLDLIRVREKQGDYKGALDSLERYLALMQERGQKPSWSDERLAELRAKVR